MRSESLIADNRLVSVVLRPDLRSASGVCVPLDILDNVTCVVEAVDAEGTRVPVLESHPVLSSSNDVQLHFAVPARLTQLQVRSSSNACVCPSSMFMVAPQAYTPQCLFSVYSSCLLGVLFL